MKFTTPSFARVTLATSLVLLAATIPPTSAALKVEVFQPGETGHYVNSGIIASSKEILIVDCQLSPIFGTRLAKRAKQYNLPVKAIYITHAHYDHMWGLQAVLKELPGTPVYASQQTVDKVTKESPMWLDPKLIRPFPHNLGMPTKIVIPTVWNQSTIELGGETIHLMQMGQGDTEHITTLDIPSSKGTTFRLWNAHSKKDIRFVPSNGTFWGSDIVISGIHFLMNEVDSLASRTAWIKNARLARDHVKTNHRSVVPGHLDDSRKWTNDEMLDFPIEYVETYNEALKQGTVDKFWDVVMKKYANSSLLFLLDWSSPSFYESSRKTPVP
ncbi:Hydroxyacylglutathione hydrolase [Mortierella sp. AD032]|nr:Hydroxyacylglutathione hydrolase [Mortierella sp. AD032]